MLFHDKGTVNIADVVRYTVTYDPHLDPSAHHGLLSRAPHLFASKTLQLRIRNTASMLLRAAYLQGPYVLAVSVREDTFHANDETTESTSSWSPVYDHDLKTSTSFWTELPAGEKYPPWRMLIRRTWIIEVASQAIFANAPTSYTISIGHTKDSTRKAANGTDLITSSPGLTIQKATTADLWKTPVIQPYHKNVHLVILTHGLHSNVTADMLYLKDRLEQTAGLLNRPDGGVVVRGYTGNVCKTERGIKYLGRRMAKWLLHETLWLDQLGIFAPEAPPYSRISFIGHSLGGVVQNFAIAWIELMTQGEFFRKLRPVHLITLASPWLGVSSENPAYVKLALDMGLIGRTGQDLGLMARLGQRFDNVPENKKIRDSRPILRLLALPNSPAHRVIRNFCTRTIYANVINDGIVPLRTSAMFFLDWNSFDTVQKSLGNNGMITQLGLPTLDHLLGGVEKIFGARKSESDGSEVSKESEGSRSSNEETSRRGSLFAMPSFLRRKSSQTTPTRNQRQRRQSLPSMRVNSFDLPEKNSDNMTEPGRSSPGVMVSESDGNQEGPGNQGNQEDERAGVPTRDVEGTDQVTTRNVDSDHLGSTNSSRPPTGQGKPETSNAAAQDETITTRDIDPNHPGNINSSRPPTGDSNNITSTNFVQSPTEIANPLVHEQSTATATGPPKHEPEDTNEGDNNSNALFSLFQHLRPNAGKQSSQSHKSNKVYRRSQTISKSPTDTRPPPPKTTFFESFPSLLNPPLPDAKFITQPECRPKTIFHDRLYTPDDIPPVSPSTSDGSDDAKREKLRLEEKIARDWHRDMTWRKVLVKLEPDAHNNIIVRRMFPNAYGWPVLEHLVKEHFSRDPEGLESAFTQETGVIPLGSETKSWDSSIMDVEEDEESVERAESEGRAGLSDEEGAVEMKDFSVGNGRSSVIPSDPEVVNSALDFHFT